MSHRGLGAFVSLLAFSVLSGGVAGAPAQGSIGGEPIQGHPWAGSRGIRQSISQLTARQHRRDSRLGGRGGENAVQIAPRPGELPARSKRSSASASPAPATASAPTGPNTPFSAGTSFLGAQLSESGFVPPDSGGSVGPTQVLVAVNGWIKVFDKQGNLGGLNVDDATFWSSVRNGQDVTDPQVEYDRLAGRWIVAAINFDASNPNFSNNRIMIAVSSGPTITSQSSFTFFQFAHNAPSPSGDNNLFADFPTLGVDKNALYIGVDDFNGNSFAHTSAFVVRKSSVLSGGPIVVTAFRNIGSNSTAGPLSPEGVQDMDPSVEQGYLIGVDSLVFSQLDIRRITDPGGTPTMSANLAVTVPTTTFPINVPAQGTVATLDALDDRLFEAMIARQPDGSLSLWTAHNIQVNAAGVGSNTGGRDGARWYELGNLGAAPSLVQSGTEFDPAAANPRFFWIPSIAANGQGNASLNSSTAGVGRFAAIASMGRLASDPLGQTGPFTIVQDSSSSYNGVSGEGTNKRWGDFSQTVVDPADDMSFWTFQEYANATDSWGVRVIKLKAPPPATPSSASPSHLVQGSPSVHVTVTGTSSGGSGFFDPGPDAGGPGYPNHISAAVSGGVDVNRATYTDPTHLTLDLDTTRAGLGTKDVTITNPDGQVAIGADLIDVRGHERSLRIHYRARRNRFQGRLSSDASACVRHQLVKVFRKRRGRDHMIGRDTTNRRGRYAVREPHARGEFYAKARRRTIAQVGFCAAARSRAIAVG